jgi:hypothetical protein
MYFSPLGYFQLLFCGNQRGFTIFFCWNHESFLFCLWMYYGIWFGWSGVLLDAMPSDIGGSFLPTFALDVFADKVPCNGTGQ